MKHQVVINVVNNDGEKFPVVKGAVRSLPAKIVKCYLENIHKFIY